MQYFDVAEPVRVFTPPGDNHHGDDGRYGIDNLVIDIADFECIE